MGGRPKKEKELDKTSANQELTSIEPSEVNVIEVKRSKRTSKPATQPPPANPAGAPVPSEKELKDRFKIAARDKRLADEHELSVQIHAGEMRRPIGYMSPQEMTSGIRQLLGKEPS